eukprot:CAMPEP_0204620048 /NCGR_PEP_ID=MMETSP0717-20131115/6206_1 /ASSEMBLY_ACC=CAM_ASM_000666 /TAXON_ID=230516 /ORGANISM="Chaetoceros curvisetus" /LENGTH=144 /DNA_ID=CAMNT_0051634151 /DNA_START=75 /DNA_END=509 /DNA_ORIENTATION=-
MNSITLFGIILLIGATTLEAFTMQQRSHAVVSRNSFQKTRNSPTSLVVAQMSKNDGVVELVDDDETTSSDSTSSSPSQQNTGAAPFLSQGEISEDALNPDLSDPKQTRVIIYIILSLLPVLFLIPLMLGSRDLIPLDALPPVEM